MRGHRGTISLRNMAAANETDREFIITGFSDSLHRPVLYKLENTTFGKLDLFPKNVVFWDVAPCRSCADYTVPHSRRRQTSQSSLAEWFDKNYIATKIQNSFLSCEWLYKQLRTAGRIFARAPYVVAGTGVRS
jgi:hypothetical protein